MEKISFSGNITFEVEKYLNKYKNLIKKIIKNDDLEFTNYICEENNSYIIPVEKNNMFSNSHIIYFDEGIRNYCDKYIRFEKKSGLYIGYILSDDTYMDLFIDENSNDKKLDEYILKWTTEKESFVKSPFVTKHKALHKYFIWTGIDKCLPNHLIIEFQIKGNHKLYELIKDFSKAGLNLKKLKSFAKKLENFNKI